MGLTALSGCAGASAASDPSAGVDEQVASEGTEAASDGPRAEHKGGAMAMMEIAGPEQPWAEMEEYDREMYMVGKVQPIMHDLFAKHDRERYGSFECETCHGNDGKELMYAMPAASIFSIPEPGTRAWENMEKGSPDTVRFMNEVVTPTMGKLLGVENYTCGNCHPPR